MTSHELVTAPIAFAPWKDPDLLADQEESADLLTTAARADYRALNRYACGCDVRIRADTHVLGGHDDHRVAADTLRRWEHHTAGNFKLPLYEGGHFYLDDQLGACAAQVNADV